MLLRSIISENFKACQKHSPFGVCSSLKMYLYFPNGQEEALTGIEVMLMQCGSRFFFFFFAFFLSVTQKYSPIFKIIILFYTTDYI